MGLVRTWSCFSSFSRSPSLFGRSRCWAWTVVGSGAGWDSHCSSECAVIAAEADSLNGQLRVGPGRAGSVREGCAFAHIIRERVQSSRLWRSVESRGDSTVSRDRSLGLALDDNQSRDRRRIHGVHRPAVATPPQEYLRFIAVGHLLSVAFAISTANPREAPPSVQTRVVNDCYSRDNAQRGCAQDRASLHATEGAVDTGTRLDVESARRAVHSHSIESLEFHAEVDEIRAAMQVLRGLHPRSRRHMQRLGLGILFDAFLPIEWFLFDELLDTTPSLEYLYVHMGNLNQAGFRYHFREHPPGELARQVKARNGEELQSPQQYQDEKVAFLGILHHRREDPRTVGAYFDSALVAIIFQFMRPLGTRFVGVGLVYWGHNGSVVTIEDPLATADLSSPAHVYRLAAR